jgi:hypothetical protein
MMFSDSARDLPVMTQPATLCRNRVFYLCAALTSYACSGNTAASKQVSNVVAGTNGAMRADVIATSGIGGSAGKFGAAGASTALPSADSAQPSAGGAAPVNTGAQAAAGGATPAIGQSASSGSHAVGDDDAGSAASAMTAAQIAQIAQIAMDLASAVCGALDACLGPQKLNALSNREPCLDHLAAALEQSDLALLPESVKQGRLVVHEAELAACYRDTKALVCAIGTQRLPASCQLALSGQVALHGVCSIDSECAGDSFCTSGMCPRHCAARQASGAACGRDEECASGLACSAGACSVPGVAGDACQSGSAAVCALGTSCVGASDTQPGRCQNNSALQVGQLGEACMPNGPLCREGLSCASDGAGTFRCQQAVSSGAACHVALPSQCPNDEYCNGTDPMTQGKCIALPKDAQACVLKQQCAPGHVCVSEGSTALCRRLADLNQPCTGDATCRSAHCERGQCAAPATCP